MTKFRVFNVNVAPKTGFSFAPGIIFLCLGLVVLFFPKFFILAMASLLLFVGSLLCYAAWKFWQFKNKLETTMKNFESKIEVRGFDLNPKDSRDIEVDEKKIVFH